MHPDVPEVTLENPAPEETVSISSVEGKTVVVNNKLDGSKKTRAMVIAGALAATLEGVKPFVPPPYIFIVEVLQMVAVFFAGTAVTSPYDKRAVILSQFGLKVGQ